MTALVKVDAISKRFAFDDVKADIVDGVDRARLYGSTQLGGDTLADREARREALGDCINLDEGGHAVASIASG